MQRCVSNGRASREKLCFGGITHHQNNSATLDEVSLEALIDNPTRSMHILSTVLV